MERHAITNNPPINLYPAIVQLYAELYKQVTVKSSRHVYVPSLQNRLLICKFIGWLNDNYNRNQLGIDFLINYFEFQFNRYIGVNSKFGKNAVAINWLIGPKAMQVWKQRDPQKKKFIKYRISKKMRLQLSKAFARQKQVTVNNLYRQMLSSVNVEEEMEKNRYYNTKVGYLYCADMTTLYNPASAKCEQCKFKVDCKERLKLNFNKIYRLRQIED